MLSESPSTVIEGSSPGFNTISLPPVIREKGAFSSCSQPKITVDTDTPNKIRNIVLDFNSYHLRSSAFNESSVTGRGSNRKKKKSVRYHSLPERDDRSEPRIETVVPEVSDDE